LSYIPYQHGLISIRYASVDLIKYETPLNSAKISKMLNQLEFKLRVEKEYMHGIEKMAKLYQVR
jgi:classical protein kinase C